MRTNTSHRPPPATGNGHRSRRPQPSGDIGGVLRVAFYTIASHDSDVHPHATVMAQYAERLTAIGAGEIRAVFFDITGAPTPRQCGVTAITRDGGMADLLAEAISPDRRFDYLITPGLKLLDRHGIPVLDILAHLDRADVTYVVRGRDLADELGYLIARDQMGGDPEQPTRFAF